MAENAGDEESVPSPPYPSFLLGEMAARFAGLPEWDQRALDEAIMSLEWDPEPDDAVALPEPGFYAVVRSGYVILYEWTEQGLEVWSIDEQ